MSLLNLKILSYHKFSSEEDDYVFSRTYKQFRSDLGTKDWDFLCFDDGHSSIIKAAKMMRDLNFRAHIFISTSLIGTEGYLTWDEVWSLSRFHFIENHSTHHIRLSELGYEEIYWNISTAQNLIKEKTGRSPRYFISPWNEHTPLIEQAANSLGLQMILNRIDMKNDSL